MKLLKTAALFVAAVGAGAGAGAAAGPVATNNNDNTLSSIINNQTSNSILDSNIKEMRTNDNSTMTTSTKGLKTVHTHIVNKKYNINDTLIKENVLLKDSIRPSPSSLANISEIVDDCDPDSLNFNCTREEFLIYRLGPQQLPLFKVLLVTIVFGVIFITSMLGNILVCVVIVRHSSMHTATNYYLFSLAVSDLLYLIFGLPAEVFLYYHQYPYLFGLPFCRIRAFISEASTYVSVLTIVAFSMERFLAICHPLHSYAMSGFKRAVRLIAALWIISFLSAIPFGFMTGIEYLSYPPDNSTILESAFCGTIAIPEIIPIFHASFCVFFVIPMILIIIVYWKMSARIRSTSSQQLGVRHYSLHRESQHQQSRKAVIHMLAAVVITFFICWLPFHVQRLYFLYAQGNPEVNEWIFVITGFAYYISCTINPILYNVMSHRYRMAFKDILCRKRNRSYYNNGFTREHSSFRETMASSVGGNSTFDRVHSERKQNRLRKSSNVVVVMDKAINGRTKCYTENEAQSSLINQSSETSI